jgi:hypothetical protein
VAGLVGPAGGLLLALVVFESYVAYSAEHPAVRTDCTCLDAVELASACTHRGRVGAGGGDPSPAG